MAELQKKGRPHRNIVLILAKLLSDDPVTTSPIGLVAELANFSSCRSLALYIKDRQLPLLGDVILRFARDIATGMAFVCESGILHLDLKPDNLLTFTDTASGGPMLKICDFGIAATVGTDVASGLGTDAYMAPEMVVEARNDEVSFATDVYSFAIILWEMFSRSEPYPGWGGYARKSVSERNVRPASLDGIPDFWANLIQTNWHDDPGSRMMFSEVQHALDDLGGAHGISDEWLAVTRRRLNRK